MILDLSKYRVDLRKWEEGVWFDVAAWLDGKRLVPVPDDGDTPALRLRAWDSLRFQSALREANEKHNPLGTEMDPARTLAMFAEAMANGLMCGVRGLTLGDAAVAENPAAFLALLQDRELPGIYDLAWQGSRQAAAYRRAVEEARLGN
jgi:hypothetical protein